MTTHPRSVASLVSAILLAVLFISSSAFGAELFSDNFNRPDADDPGNGWGWDGVISNASNPTDNVSIFNNQIRIHHTLDGTNQDGAIFRPFSDTCGIVYSGKVEWIENLAAIIVGVNGDPSWSPRGFSLSLYPPPRQSGNHIYVYNESTEVLKFPFSFNLTVPYQFEWIIYEDCSTDIRVWESSLARPSERTAFTSSVTLLERANPQLVAMAAGGSGCCAYLGYDVRIDDIIVESIDNEGPTTNNVIADPNPVVVGMPIDLTAYVDDSTTGGSDIASAKYTIDGGSDIGIDGISGAVSEDVSAIIPSYDEAGVHEICVSGTDVAGNTGNEECIFLAVYDPDGGFVTGGGWINSPANACDPGFCGGASGKANFGFVSKYQQGATVPTGQTEFNFKAGNLNFHSTSYDFLVIAGAKAIYKGSGTINGSGNYSFQINAIDGQVNGGGGVDKFRIKIQGGGSGVVYDNQPGAGENDEPTTAIGGGSIKIHK